MSKTLVLMVASGVAVRVAMGALVLAGSIGLDVAPAGAACTCDTLPRARDFELADVAFVGHLLSTFELDKSGEVRLTFSVSEPIKGNPGSRFQIPWSNLIPAIAGPLPCPSDSLDALGDVGILAQEQDDGSWGLQTCGITTPSAIRAFVEPLPSPTGRGPPAHLVGYSLGPARVAMLDSRGEVLAYGMGNDSTWAFALCPDNERVVELVADPRFMQPKLAVRDLTTLEVVGEQHLGPERIRRGALRNLQCHDPSGEQVSYLLIASGREEKTRWHVWHGEGREEIDVGLARSVTLSPAADRLYTLIPNGQILYRWDLGTGTEILPYQSLDGAAGTGLGLSGDRARLAIAAGPAAFSEVGADTARLTDRLLLGSADGTLVPHDLGASGRLLAFVATPTGYAVTVATDSEMRTSMLNPEGRMIEVVALDGSDVGAVSSIPGSALYTGAIDDPQADLQFAERTSLRSVALTTNGQHELPVELNWTVAATPLPPTVQVPDVPVPDPPFEREVDQVGTPSGTLFVLAATALMLLAVATRRTSLGDRRRHGPGTGGP